MTNTLDKAKIGSNCLIIKVNGDKPIKRRLRDMGLFPGTTIYVLKFAPLGDPIEIRVKSTELTLRKMDAINILVDEIAED
ncbi:MAG: ferrous iron transport protein A [Candidatus Izemoplasmatales bacterium]